ncbi:MAG: hypothetical protein GY798_15710 [Hyphomicrobiales bacterium]|nr:hypothetical protein [Hyphomicrobiales bacterium]
MKSLLTYIGAAGLIVASVLAASAARADDACRPELSDADIAAIKEVVKIWSDSAGSGAYKKWLSYFTEDAVLMPPGHASIKGKAAISDFVQKDVGPLTNFTLTNWQFDGACGVGIVSSDFVAGALKDKHVVVLHRQSDGSWLINRVIYNTNAPS